MGRQKILDRIVAGIPIVRSAFNLIMDTILICLGCSQMFKLCHTFKGCNYSSYLIYFTDSFLRNRNSHDHEATAMMKAQFMSLWDGLITNPDCTVIVMGATNRPQDLDRAILRRMPATFHIGLPVSFL